MSIVFLLTLQLVILISADLEIPSGIVCEKASFRSMHGDKTPVESAIDNLNKRLAEQIKKKGDKAYYLIHEHKNGDKVFVEHGQASPPVIITHLNAILACVTVQAPPPK